MNQQNNPNLINNIYTMNVKNNIPNRNMVYNNNNITQIHNNQNNQGGFNNNQGNQHVNNEKNSPKIVKDENWTTNKIYKLATCVSVRNKLGKGNSNYQDNSPSIFMNNPFEQVFSLNSNNINVGNSIEVLSNFKKFKEYIYNAINNLSSFYKNCKAAAEKFIKQVSKFKDLVISDLTELRNIDPEEINKGKYSKFIPFILKYKFSLIKDTAYTKLTLEELNAFMNYLEGLEEKNDKNINLDFLDGIVNGNKINQNNNNQNNNKGNPSKVNSSDLNGIFDFINLNNNNQSKNNNNNNFNVNNNSSHPDPKYLNNNMFPGLPQKHSNSNPINFNLLDYNNDQKSQFHDINNYNNNNNNYNNNNNHNNNNYNNNNYNNNYNNNNYNNSNNSHLNNNDPNFNPNLARQLDIQDFKDMANAKNLPDDKCLKYLNNTNNVIELAVEQYFKEQYGGTNTLKITMVFPDYKEHKLEFNLMSHPDDLFTQIYVLNPESSNPSLYTSTNVPIIITHKSRFIGELKIAQNSKLYVKFS